jgi:hypothetical protein
MVGHKAVSVADPVVAFVGVLEGIEEVQAVLLVLEYGFLLVPAGGDVINSAGIFYAKGTGHNIATISRRNAIVKLQDVTL